MMYFFHYQKEHIEKMLEGKAKATPLEPSAMDPEFSEEVELTISPDQPLKSIVNYTKFFTEIKID